MSTIKSPQTLNKNINKGSVKFLLILTWLAMALGFYAVNVGIIQPDTEDSAVSDRLSALEAKVQSLDEKLIAIEKSSSDEQVEESPSAPAPDATSPDAMSPAEPIKPENGTAEPVPAPVSPTEPTLNAPLEKPTPLEDKNDAAPSKPQSNNNTGSADRALLEKKSSLKTETTNSDEASI